ncbi:MAG: iron-sulfur cluster assembly scaffold protein [Candidatus ainarchaeum sp.]|jgi:NifU-like protein involved in Fe-S cluster formation|nr:iron-sulfur cluster assembly scaffold protein [Candidatus ainarchaeum sp.]MDD3085534.1 iron-sulfur cluster assembly scaffold protein [Candidatus ainarchaeum sp.]MDD4128121.1 iron-sulfur cluster assembly scaffold protein [Candidatus ainarchaeum sp.]
MKLEGNDWIYSKKVKEHFIKPKNFLKNQKEIKDFNGHGSVGNIKCGDLMEMWIKVKNNKIINVKWKTFGCASAIASTSMLSEMLLEKGGMQLEKALKITGKDIMDRLGGLPAIKIHCSVLGDQALRAAIYDYAQKNKRTELSVEKPIEEEHH